MKKCDCYDVAEEIFGWLNSDTPILKEVSRCYGTKEREECACGGDRSQCDFYPEIRAESQKN